MTDHDCITYDLITQVNDLTRFAAKFMGPRFELIDFSYRNLGLEQNLRVKSSDLCLAQTVCDYSQHCELIYYTQYVVFVAFGEIQTQLHLPAATTNISVCL